LRLLGGVDFRPVLVGLSQERMDDNFAAYRLGIPVPENVCSQYIWRETETRRLKMPMPLQIADLLGYAAAGCTTLSFIPQLMKIRKEGGAGLSYAMLAIYLAGLMLWLAYGVLIHATAVMLANAASGLLVAGAIVLKATSRSRVERELKLQSEIISANAKQAAATNSLSAV